MRSRPRPNRPQTTAPSAAPELSGMPNRLSTSMRGLHAGPLRLLEEGIRAMSQGQHHFCPARGRLAVFLNHVRRREYY